MNRQREETDKNGELYSTLETDKHCFRLLRRLSTSVEVGSDLMHFSLEAMAISDAPRYVALSYCWGAPYTEDGSVIKTARSLFPDQTWEDWQASCRLDWESDNHPILCNGLLVSVRLNLFEALKALSKREEFVNIWVDALCIDQSSDAEKGHQIGLMGAIYGRASPVLVWLGQERYEASPLRALLAEFDPIFRYWGQDFSVEDVCNDDPRDETYCKRWRFNDKSFALRIQNWIAYAELLSRSWFYRRWTLQEAVVAKQVTILCGTQSFSIDKLRRLSSYIHYSKWYDYIRTVLPDGDKMPGSATHAFLPINKVRVARLRLQEGLWQDICLRLFGACNLSAVLTYLLQACAVLQVTEPSDVIYAIHSITSMLSSEEPKEVAAVDYSMYTARLYQLVAERIIIDVPNLMFLSLYRSRSRLSALPSALSMPNLPSWVPRFAANAFLSENKYLGFYFRPGNQLLFNVAFQQESKPQRRVENNKLYIKAIYLGTIDVCSSPHDEWDDGFFNVLYDLPQTIQGSPAIDAFWRTLVFDVENFYHPATGNLEECFEGYLEDKILRDPSIPKDVLEDRVLRIRQLADKINTEHVKLPESFPKEQKPNSRSEAAEIFTAATEIATGRYLFKTNSGNIGYGPPSQRPGDQVWAFENTSIPFVLRPSHPTDPENWSTGTYELLEECFVYGVMNQELLSNEAVGFQDLCIV